VCVSVCQDVLRPVFPPCTQADRCKHQAKTLSSYHVRFRVPMCVCVCRCAKTRRPPPPPSAPRKCAMCRAVCHLVCVCAGVPKCVVTGAPPLHPGETKEKNKKPLWNTSSLASMLLHMVVGHGSRAYTHEKQLYTSIPFHQKCDRLTAVSNPLVCYLVCVCVCVCRNIPPPFTLPLHPGRPV
jgi:hypothetical protein